MWFVPEPHFAALASASTCSRVLSFGAYRLNHHASPAFDDLVIQILRPARRLWRSSCCNDQHPPRSPSPSDRTPNQKQTASPYCERLTTLRRINTMQPNPLSPPTVQHTDSIPIR